MDRLPLYFSGAVVLSAVLGAVAIWAPRKVWIKLTSLFVIAGFAPLAYGGLAELLSRPKPVSLEWAKGAVKEAVVLGSLTKEGEAIYLLLALPELDEPRFYALPWQRSAAEQLQQERRQAERQGGQVMMLLPFEASVDTETPKFYPRPQEALPPKPAPAQPLQFQHPNRAS